MIRTLFLLAAATCTLPGELVDRVAVALGNQAVTLSAIDEQIRVSAFLNRQPADFSPVHRRRMAERMIEQTLLRREMEASRFTLPGGSEVSAALERTRKDRGETEAEFQAAMTKYGVGADALARNLVFQLTILRFIELRFRPGSTVSDGEVEIYYRETFVPAWERRNAAGVTPPDLDDAREEIEQVLLQTKVDQSMDEWLKQTRARTRVRFLEEAFQ